MIPAVMLLLMTATAAEEFYWLRDNSKVPEGTGRFSIYKKNDILFCSGDDPAGSANNSAANLMLEGKFSEALKILDDGLERAPLFFPFRYNAGICNLYMNRLKESLMHLTKASQIVPEYHLVYLQIGYVYDRMNREADAIEHYRIGLKKNPKELNTYILIGDIFFNRNQLREARKYYNETINIHSRFPNGILGLAKIHYKNREYLKAIVLLKTVDLTGEYDKSYHYYFAESAFKIGDYRMAVEQYETLLKYRTDRFFLVNSVLLIRHKLELSKRFTER